MRLSTLLIGWFGVASLASAGVRLPVTVLRQEAGAPLAANRIVYAQEGAVVMRNAAATDADFADVYAVNLALHMDLPEWLAARGDVLAFAPGRFAVMRLSPDNAAAVAARLHGEAHACGLLERVTGQPISIEAAATPTPLVPVAARDARVAAAVAAIDVENIKATVAELAAMPTRLHDTTSGDGVADVLASKYQALAGGRADVTISKYDHGAITSQPSLIVRIEGTTRPTELLVLGSHLDSINADDEPNGRSPGADDNASGTATNLEIFRVLMANGVRPERTVEIHAYAAEEAGLLGSKDIANAYHARGVNVVAMVQHDMTMWKPAGAADKIYFVTSNTTSGFNDQLVQLAGFYAGVPTQKLPLFMGSSDHASWRRAGYATAFPFENPFDYNPHVHTATDDVSNASAATLAAAFAKLGLSFVLHFGGV